jgi:hypothetical protein
MSYGRECYYPLSWIDHIHFRLLSSLSQDSHIRSLSRISAHPHRSWDSCPWIFDVRLCSPRILFIFHDGIESRNGWDGISHTERLLWHKVRTICSNSFSWSWGWSCDEVPDIILDIDAPLQTWYTLLWSYQLGNSCSEWETVWISFCWVSTFVTLFNTHYTCLAQVSSTCLGVLRWPVRGRDQ